MNASGDSGCYALADTWTQFRGHDRPVAAGAALSSCKQYDSGLTTAGGCSHEQCFLAQPENVVRIKYLETVGFLVCHLIAALAFLPWFFSWTGVILLFVGNFVFGVNGINLTYHRLVSHRAFSCPRWFECTLAIIGASCLQYSPAHWAAVHRRHHHHTDDENDPHSPLKSFFWGHMGWLLVKKENLTRRPLLERYAKDLMRDAFYASLREPQ